MSNTLSGLIDKDSLYDLLKKTLGELSADVKKQIPIGINGSKDYSLSNGCFEIKGIRKSLKKYVPDFKTFNNLLIGMNDCFGELKSVTINNSNSPFDSLKFDFKNEHPGMDEGLSDSLSNESINKSLFDALISMRNYKFNLKTDDKVLFNCVYDNAELSVCLPHKLRLCISDYCIMAFTAAFSVIGSIMKAPSYLVPLAFCINYLIDCFKDETMVSIKVKNEKESIINCVKLIDQTIKSKPKDNYKLEIEYENY